MPNPRKLLAWLKRRSAPREEATDYDGFLSYAGEWHALIIGMSTGFTAAVLARPMLLAGLFGVALGIKSIQTVKFRGRGVASELKREPWYACGGGLLGYVAAGGPLAEIVTALPL